VSLHRAWPKATGHTVLSLGACDVVFIACECELLPHACSAGDAARVVCTHRTSLHAGIRSSLCCT
jgi:hypothetical protein